MKHYVCAGDCGGVSRKPDECQTETCPMFNEVMEECECEDMTHNMDKVSDEADDEEESEEE